MTNTVLRLPAHMCLRIIDLWAVISTDTQLVVRHVPAEVELLRLADGTRSVQAIVEQIAPAFGMAQSYFCLDRLKSDGLLIDTACTDPSPREVYQEELAQRRSPRRLPASITVHTLSRATLSSLHLLLHEVGLEVVDTGSDMHLVLVDDYRDRRIAPLGEHLRKLGRTWLLARLTGSSVMCGPVFRPHSGFCAECMLFRVRSNSPYPAFLEEVGLEVPNSRSGETAATQQLARSMVVTRIATLDLGASPSAPDQQIVEWDTITFSVTRHQVHGRPLCACCGTGDGPTEPIDVGRLRTPPEDFLDGRSADAGVAWQLVEPHISPLTGMVRSVVESKGDAPGVVRLQNAEHAFMHRSRNFRSFLTSALTTSGGKSPQVLNAKVAAAAEAIERSCSRYRPGRGIDFVGTLAELRDRAILPNSSTLWSDRQFADRELINEEFGGQQRVAAPIGPDTSLEWTQVTSLSGQGARFLPTGNLFYGCRSADWRYTFADSNGAAAGSTRQEALFSGFMELFERDAVALWWFNRYQVCEVSTRHLRSDLVERVRTHLRSLGRSMWLLNITNDLNVPTVVAVSRRTEHISDDVIFGFGCHFNPTLAVEAAVLEMFQSLPMVVDTADDGATLYRPLNDLAMRWWRETSLESEIYLAPKGHPPIDVNDLGPDGGWSTGTVDDCLRVVETVGLQAYMYDFTEPEIGLPVCKVLVPGLRHFWLRFAAGRLYDVPVALGHLPSARREHELNPFPVFF